MSQIDAARAVFQEGATTQKTPFASSILSLGLDTRMSKPDSPAMHRHQSTDLAPLNIRSRDDHGGAARNATVLPSIASLLSTTAAPPRRDVPFSSPSAEAYKEQQTPTDRILDFRRGREASQRGVADDEFRAQLQQSRFTPHRPETYDSLSNYSSRPKPFAASQGGPYTGLGGERDSEATMQSSFLQPITITNGRTMNTTMQRDAMDQPPLRRNLEHYFAQSRNVYAQPPSIPPSRTPRMSAATKEHHTDRVAMPSHSSYAPNQRDNESRAGNAADEQFNREHWMRYRHMSKTATGTLVPPPPNKAKFLPARQPRDPNKEPGPQYRTRLPIASPSFYHPYPSFVREPPFPSVVPSYGTQMYGSYASAKAGARSNDATRGREHSSVTTSRKENVPLPLPAAPARSPVKTRPSPNLPQPIHLDPIIRCTYCLNHGLHCDGRGRRQCYTCRFSHLPSVFLFPATPLPALASDPNARLSTGYGIVFTEEYPGGIRFDPREVGTYPETMRRRLPQGTIGDGTTEGELKVQMVLNGRLEVARERDELYERMPRSAGPSRGQAEAYPSPSTDIRISDRMSAYLTRAEDIASDPWWAKRKPGRQKVFGGNPPPPVARTLREARDSREAVVPVHALAETPPTIPAVAAVAEQHYPASEQNYRVYQQACQPIKREPQSPRPAKRPWWHEQLPLSPPSNPQSDRLASLPMLRGNTNGTSTSVPMTRGDTNGTSTSERKMSTSSSASLLEEVASRLETQTAEVAVKRKRGRPKGSKNKKPAVLPPPVEKQDPQPPKRSSSRSTTATASSASTTTSASSAEVLPCGRGPGPRPLPTRRALIPGYLEANGIRSRSPRPKKRKITRREREDLTPELDAELMAALRAKENYEESHERSSWLSFVDVIGLLNSGLIERDDLPCDQQADEAGRDVVLPDYHHHVPNTATAQRHEEGPGRSILAPIMTDSEHSTENADGDASVSTRGDDEDESEPVPMQVDGRENGDGGERAAKGLRPKPVPRVLPESAPSLIIKKRKPGRPRKTESPRSAPSTRSESKIGVVPSGKFYGSLRTRRKRVTV